MLPRPTSEAGRDRQAGRPRPERRARRKAGAVLAGSPAPRSRASTHRDAHDRRRAACSLAPWPNLPPMRQAVLAKIEAGKRKAIAKPPDRTFAGRSHGQFGGSWRTVPRFGFCLGRHFHLGSGAEPGAGSARAPFSAMVTRLSPAEHDAARKNHFPFRRSCSSRSREEASMSLTQAKRGAPQGEARFDWSDPFELEHQLSEDERMVRDTARDYAQGKLLPRVTSAYLEERFDREIMNEMGALGLLGPTLPEEYGGAGLGYVAYGLAA